MHSTPLYAPDGMTRSGRDPERFDDGLVHNHHWAVTADEAYPSQGRNAATESDHGTAFAAVHVSPPHSRGTSAHTHDRHDDGLVHNHEWAVTGK